MKNLISFLFFSISIQLSVGQSNSIANETCMKMNGAYFKSYLTDTRDIIVSPFHWQGKQWIQFGGVAVLGAVLYTQDENIQRWSQTLRNKPTDAIVKYGIEPWGNGVYTIPLIAGFGIYGLAAHDDKAREVSLIATKTFILSTAANQLSKFIFQRHRPYQDEPPNSRKWEGFWHGNTGYNSFPSGHSTEAWAMASTFAYAYKDKKAVPIICYSLASMVSLSRIYDNKHWASDVFIGSALGFFMGRFIYFNSTRK